ncbi:MAG: alanine racemase [Candidatus Omnitrophica bacterium]|nr:alanine racemase [Candidatus Omnitrophota bacterium]MDD5487634.1 alanine racemase [Candidatus Omnitrophota bacterium]
MTMERKSYRPTWAEIDLRALRWNLASIRKLVDKDTAIMAVVKANAYGHGIVETSRALVDAGINYLGVATVDEGLRIRKAGMTVPVLVMGSILREEAVIAVKNDLTVTLCDLGVLSLLKDIAAGTGVRPKVHIEVDTGMGRIGVWHEEAVEFIKNVREEGSIELEGIYTHFSSAARDKVFTTMQIESFEKVLSGIEAAGINVRYKHAANSVAVVDWKRSHLNLVRTGILLYGVYPKEAFRKSFKLRPVMSLKTKIVYLKDAPVGRSISYGRTYITQKETKIATIPIGYADGYGRILSNKAEALIKGKFVKVVGIVTMDQTMLDVGDIGGVQVGDEVVLIGRQGFSEIPIEKIAKHSGTIPYEILASVTDRVPRIYIDQS